VAINVSRRLLREPGFPQLVSTALAGTGVTPGLVAFDLPFGAFVRRPLHVGATASKLAKLGVVVIADDVTGDPARAALANPPVSALKIPLYPAAARRSGLHPRAAAAVALAGELGAAAVAKAVENTAELETLRALGFDRAFGHVYAPAVTPEALAGLLDAPV
jgi:EAL domain-containing protein (putative c-di-GMP-specific phosphodiesterase class I)